MGASALAVAVEGVLWTEMKMRVKRVKSQKWMQTASATSQAVSLGSVYNDSVSYASSAEIKRMAYIHLHL